MDKTALFNLSYGLYVVSTKDGERNVGCVVNSVFQVTSSPATLALSINKENYTNPCILKKGSFVVSMLCEKADENIISTFGFSSSKDKDKFQDFKTSTTDSGLPILTSGMCSYLECKVINTVDCFTHTIVIAEIVDGKNLFNEPPMTYAYYRNVIKGKTPKNATTYVESSKDEPAKAEPPKAVTKYVCEICGYEYPDDDFESLPDSYECPICAAPKSEFK